MDGLIVIACIVVGIIAIPIIGFLIELFQEILFILIGLAILAFVGAMVLGAMGAF